MESMRDKAAPYQYAYLGADYGLREVNGEGAGGRDGEDRRWLALA